MGPSSWIVIMSLLSRSASLALVPIGANDGQVLSWDWLFRRQTLLSLE